MKDLILDGPSMRRDKGRQSDLSRNHHSFMAFRSWFVLNEKIRNKQYKRRVIQKEKKINNNLLIAGFCFHFLSHLNFYVDIISTTTLN